MDKEMKDGALSHKAKGGAKETKKESSGGHRKPHMSIHPHHDESGAHTGNTLHVMHHDGTHEMHHFAPDDSEGMAGVMADHYGAGGGDGGAAPAEPAPGDEGGAPEPEPGQ